MAARFFKLSIITSFIFVILFFLFLIFQNNNSDIQSPLGQTKGFLEHIIDKEIKREDPVETLIKSESQNLKGTWAIAIKDLKRNKTYSYNDTQNIPSASLYKLAVMWKAYDSIEKGELSKNDIVAEEKEKLDTTLQEEPELKNNEGNTQESPQPNEEKDIEIISYPVEYALQLMIRVSDNYSAILLSNRLGWNNIDQLMEKEDLAGIGIEEDLQVTASAVQKLLERIYNGTAVSKNAAEEMNGLLLDQRINNRIPKYLPKETKVAHKTGELGGIRHDAGIVYGKNGDYIFVFLTNTNDPLDATETIAVLSKKFFDELEKQND